MTVTLFARLLLDCDLLTPQGIPQQKNDSDCGVFVLEVRHYSFPPLQLSSVHHPFLLFLYLISCPCLPPLLAQSVFSLAEKEMKRSCVSSVFPPPGFDTNMIFAQVSKGAKGTGEKLLPLSTFSMVT